jgi:rhomboid family GlyGly-CTERM serine protease
VGRKAPPLRGAAAATVLLGVPALVVALVPGAAELLQYDRAALGAGEAWRVLACHWTHWTGEHLIWDLAAFAVLAFLAWRVSPRRCAIVLALAGVAIPAAVAFGLPAMDRYRGLSGLDSALFVFVAASMLGTAGAAGRRRIGLVLAAFLAKIGFEIVTGAAVFVDASAFVPVPLAHLAGAACGWLATLDLSVLRGPSCECGCALPRSAARRSA